MESIPSVVAMDGLYSASLTSAGACLGGGGPAMNHQTRAPETTTWDVSFEQVGHMDKAILTAAPNGKNEAAPHENSRA